ncbi:hypothetical protein ACAW74_06435 [Fibrella sp. WM1]|uniref:hypothetical protein n=1 Tax=Fibrella musci TaxID=3242485 RepID=UPI003520C71E
MHSDIKTQFLLEVQQSYLSYLSIKKNMHMGDSTDLRKAMECATPMYHFGEHLADYLSKDFNKEFNEEIKRDCSDYSLLKDVVNVHKHRKINRGKISLSNINQVQEVLCIIEFKDFIGKYTEAEKMILLTLDDGRERDLLEVLTNVINNYYTLMVKYKILKEPKHFKYNRDVIIPRANDHNGIAKMNLFATSGTKPTFTFRMEKYNYEKK